MKRQRPTIQNTPSPRDRVARQTNRQQIVSPLASPLPQHNAVLMHQMLNHRRQTPVPSTKLMPQFRRVLSTMV